MFEFRKLLDGAGIGHLGMTLPVLVIVGLSALIGTSLSLVTGMHFLFVAGLLLSLLAIIEALKTAGNLRRNAILAGLPEVAESLASSIAAGVDPLVALSDIANNGPKSLSKSLAMFAELESQGFDWSELLTWLRVELSNVHSDQLIELLLLSRVSGGYGLVTNLNRLALNIRSEIALQGELQAKQGWVIGTAKLAIFAPWIVAIMLSRRPEALDFYNSIEGLGVLSVGLAVCLVAYAIINAFGKLPTLKRVFA